MGKPAPWTDHDGAIWHTFDIAAAVLGGSVRERPELSSPFPPQAGAAEKMLVSGTFQLLAYGAPGDGTYRHQGGFILAGGVAGLALTAASVVGRQAGNARRRNAAVAAATPRWMPVDSGNLWVSTHGFYMHTAQGLFAWTWPQINTAQMVGPGDVHIQGDSTTGPISWIIRGNWSELLFVLWALAHHSQHPQLISGGWLPPGWLDHCAAHGNRPDQQIRVLTQGRTRPNASL
ncbi:MAG: hypothetical protein JO246_14245 [Frankiaceae bacterium]|nr:hypothetical protein [Frankiaceae bacterium]MBV9872950.1 hypothetical protein [Frankiaceae bacterium]